MYFKFTKIKICFPKSISSRNKSFAELSLCVGLNQASTIWTGLVNRLLVELSLEKRMFGKNNILNVL